MQKRNIFFSVAAVLMVIAVSGCSPMAKVAVTKPAEIDLNNINKVVMGNIWGNRGLQMQDTITDKLFASQKYDVVDRASFDRIVRQQSFSFGKEVDEEEARRIGNVLGTSVMISGSSSSNFNYRRGREPYVDRDGMKRTKNRVDATLQLSTRLRVIELSSGRIIGQKNISKYAKRTTYATDHWADVPNPDVMARPLINQTAAEFMRMIAPYTIYVYVKFEDATTPDGEKGIELAQVGRWGEAISPLQYEAKQTNTAAAWYNLGLAYQYSYRFDEAKEAFRTCISIEALSGCAQGLNNVDQMIRDENRLKAQGTR